MRIRYVVSSALAAIVVAVVAVALSHGSGGSGSGLRRAVVTGNAVHVVIQNFAFHAQALTVTVGTRVTWTNEDGTAHTATADQGTFDTGTLNRGQAATIDFKRPGTFAYHCSFHAFMTGTITVVR
jgi:plastocyanin